MSNNKNNLKDWLINNCYAGQLCVIREGENLLSLIYIDKHGNFWNSINPDLLDLEVRYTYYDKFRFNDASVGAQYIFIIR